MHSFEVSYVPARDGDASSQTRNGEPTKIRVFFRKRHSLTWARSSVRSSRHRRATASKTPPVGRSERGTQKKWSSFFCCIACVCFGPIVRSFPREMATDTMNKLHHQSYMGNGEQKKSSFVACAFLRWMAHLFVRLFIPSFVPERDGNGYKNASARKSGEW